MEEPTVDSGIVTHECWCGSRLFEILVSFEEYEIATYSLDMYCTNCQAKHRAPTPLDRIEE